MRKLGLADCLGLIAVLVAVAWLPGAADPLTYIKLLFLSVGGLAIAPTVIVRWRALGRPQWLWVAPSAAAVLLIVWGLVSAVGSGAPVWNSAFGWWGRGDGWLAWLGALFLLLGAATLSTAEISRAITWVLGGASFVAAVGLLQVVGVSISPGVGGQVSGTMGNTNFAAGYFAITALLALGRAAAPGATWQRVWGGALFILLALLSWMTQSSQGPVALAAGILVGGVTYSLLYRGRWRRQLLAASGVFVAIVAAFVIMSFFARGPLALLWAERTFDIRQQYWQSAVNIMRGLPVFGTGPDGFSRYVAEFRPESYVELLGPTLRVSAAHNVALQFGASLGFVGLILWVVIFAGAGVLLLIRAIRKPVGSLALTASVAGAFAAYVVQGMVSIDMLPLLATGWFIAGLALACAREPEPRTLIERPTQPATRKGRAAAIAAASSRPEASRTPLWASLCGGALAIAVFVLMTIQIGLTNQIQTISDQEQALSFITNPMTPCVLRTQVTQQVIQQLPADVSVPATLQATDLDRRCPPMVNFASDVLVQQQRIEEAADYTAEGVEFDPLLDLAWVLRGRYFLGIGDLALAEAAAQEARRVQNLYQEPIRDPALIEGLLTDIALAKEQSGQ